MRFDKFRNLAADLITAFYEEEYGKMPAKITKVKGGYKVSTPSGTHAKHTTKVKAQSQARLLNAIDHGWKPTGKRKK